jgi:hypothetical protein
MTSAILLRSGVNRKVHAPFWSQVGRGNPPGLGNDEVDRIIEIGLAYFGISKLVIKEKE